MKISYGNFDVSIIPEAYQNLISQQKFVVINTPT